MRPADPPGPRSGGSPVDSRTGRTPRCSPGRSGCCSGGSLPARVVGRLVDRSAGNPLFIEESVRMLVETDVLARGDEGWLLKDLHGVERVPTTLRALVSARIDALAPEEKRALQDASITGQV